MTLKNIYTKFGIEEISIDFNLKQFNNEFVFACRFFSGTAIGFYPFTIVVWRI